MNKKAVPYLHIGNNQTVRSSEIIGIFDLDSATISHETRKFLREAEKKGQITSAADALPKSFILTKDKIYFSQLSSATLQGRLYSETLV